MGGQKICFVIDYSASMRGKRIELLKAELGKTIHDLPDGIRYQLLFFAGPVWTAGDTIARYEPGTGRKNTVTHKGKDYNWSYKKSFGAMAPSEEFKVEWQLSTPKNREVTARWVQETPLVYGTDWKSPLFIAMGMAPKPDLVIFLTDGLSINALGKAQDAARVAKKSKIQVNTIALMKPQAREALQLLASETGGEFSLINEDGQKVDERGRVIRRKSRIKKRK